MSQYLSQFYCGNTKNLCNYDKPIDYSSLLDRQFDEKQYNKNNCQGMEKLKVYFVKKKVWKIQWTKHTWKK